MCRAPDFIRDFLIVGMVVNPKTTKALGITFPQPVLLRADEVIESGFAFALWIREQHPAELQHVVGGSLRLRGRLRRQFGVPLIFEFPAGLGPKPGKPALFRWGECGRMHGKSVAQAAHGGRELPMQQPKKSELVVNMKTARALGLKIRQSVLLKADEMIE